MSSRRVAFVQPTMIMGGRLQVILEMARCLNELGIVPEVLTHRLKFDPDQVKARYGVDVQLQFKEQRPFMLWPGEFNTAVFNAWLNRVQGSYDLLINTSNSLINLPPKAKVLTYMFFPRKSRIFAGAADIHDPEQKPVPLFSIAKLLNGGARMLYRRSKPYPNHQIICMNEFTREALLTAYPKLDRELPVIPPPVHLEEFYCRERDRLPAVVTVGRFEAAKGQLRQIQLAGQLPELTFHIIGFVADENYFERCRTTVREQGLENVILHPQASFKEMVSLLKSSRYFLHSTVNEPFGITAIQAMAAGCIPLVHDSGGQRQTVPLDRLRYRQLDEAAGIIRGLERETAAILTSMVETCQAHIQQFDQQQFALKMRPVFEELLKVR